MYKIKFTKQTKYGEYYVEIAEEQFATCGELTDKDALAEHIERWKNIIDLMMKEDKPDKLTDESPI